MRLVWLAAVAAALVFFGWVVDNSPDALIEAPAAPSVNVPVTTPSVDVPVTAPVTKTSTKHKHRKHHHRHRHPAKQPEPAAGTANNPEVPQTSTPFELNGWQSN